MRRRRGGASGAGIPHGIRRRTTLRAAAVALALGAASGAARDAAAQATCATNPCALPVTATLAVNDVASLAVSSTAVNLGAPTAAAMAGAGVVAMGPTITVRSNRPVRVQVSAGASTFSRDGGASAKPASDVAWGTAPGLQPNTADVPAIALDVAAPTTGTSRTLWFRTRWRFDRDVPGTYALPLTIVLTAP